jgi:predicted nucleic acid-binding Zn ribbon protein
VTVGVTAHRNPAVSRCAATEITPTGRQRQREARTRMGILWIILIVILVLALLGFFSRGYW